ncbi:MAG: Holliday junction resolvase RuvX [Acidimicrobiia bacterium]|nr:Holliday junction resolvase RuvX [Acidimicrobiia bacterium]MDH3399123.1 Holliday junction resolvase RuvX [Acidimicrobiia bacterium]
MTLGRIMGLDYGTRRIGVAMSDPLHLTAQPHAVLDAESKQLSSEFRRLVDDNEVELIVVGLPVNLSGEETTSAGGARRLAARVAEITGCPVEMADERFSTKTAEQTLIGANVRRRRRKQVIDKVAAAVMLQTFLDGR